MANNSFQNFLTTLEDITPSSTDKTNPSDINKQWQNRQLPSHLKQEYSILFNKIHSKDSTQPPNFLKKETAFELFSKSGLSVLDIERLWHLINPREKTGSQISVEQFVVAMFLVQCKLENKELWPTKLSENLLDFSTITRSSFDDASPLLPSSNEAAYSVVPIKPLTEKKPTPPPSDRPKPKAKTPSKNITFGKSGKVTPWKVVVIGDQIGKSSILSRFLFNQFYEHPDETVEDSYDVIFSSNGVDYEFHILDTAGSDHYYDTMHQKWFSGADGFILVYAIDDLVSFKRLDLYRNEIMRLVKDDRVPTVVAGTKLDRDDARAVGNNQGLRWAQLHSYGFCECSAKTGDGITQVFMALIARLEKNAKKGLEIPTSSHHWEKRKLKGSAKCAHCKKSIWNLLLNAEGYVCQVCGATVHKNCKDKVPANCNPNKQNNSVQKQKGSSLSSSVAEEAAPLPKSPKEWKELINTVTTEDLLNHLQDPDQLAELKKFFEKKQEPSILIKIWCSIEGYRTAVTLDSRKTLSFELYDFLAKNSQYVGLPFHIFQELRSLLSKEIYGGSEFSSVENFVYQQLEKKWFPQFLKRTMQNTLKTMPEQYKKALQFEEALQSLDQLLINEEKTSSAAKPSANQIFNTQHSKPKYDIMPVSPVQAVNSDSTQPEESSAPPPPDEQSLPAPIIAPDSLPHPPDQNNSSLPMISHKKTPSDLPSVASYGEIEAKVRGMKDLWYFGQISRIDAETTLMSTEMNCFLIRNSSQQGCYALSKYSQITKAFIHFLIVPDSIGFKISDCPSDSNTYPDVETLVRLSPVLNGFKPAKFTE